jgi:hypothetical protein
MAEKRFLQTISYRRTSRESFDSRDFVSFDLPSRHQAGARRITVDQNRAGAAVAGVAADFGPGHPETLAQNFGEPFHG